MPFPAWAGVTKGAAKATLAANAPAKNGVLAFISRLRCFEPIEAVRLTIGMHRLRSTPGRGFRPRSKRFLPIAVALALKTDTHAADVDDRKPVWSGKIPGNSGGLRALYAAGAIATAIIAVNGPMAALFLSGAARTGRRALVAGLRRHEARSCGRGRD